MPARNAPVQFQLCSHFDWIDSLVTHQFATRAEARTAIFEFIEVWYNRQRIHSSLGYLSPEEFERQFLDSSRVR